MRSTRTPKAEAYTHIGTTAETHRVLRWGGNVQELREQAKSVQRYRSWINFLLLAIVFGISYTQFPLYYSSQNQYFFQGLARSGFGFLRNDWLAQTADSWPVFSLLVQLTYRYLDERVFYFYHLLLAGTYVYSIIGIALPLFSTNHSSSIRLTYLAFMTVLHAPIFGYLSTNVLGFNVGGQLLSGVALQQVLGPMLQPSAFGVLLLLSIHLFLRGKPVLSIASSSFAAVINPTYLLSAGVLTLSFMVIMLRRGERVTKPLRLGVYAFVFILPVLVYVYAVFGPTSPDVWTQAQDILVHFRMPHHAVPHRWLGPMVYVKIAVTLTAVYLVRRTELFWIILLSFGAAVALTVAQILSDSDTLALLFPWRLSVFLVPLSTCIILAYLLSRVVTAIASRFPRIQSALITISIVTLVVLVSAGVAEMRQRFDAKARDRTRSVMTFVSATKSPGHTYLIPQYWESFRLRTGAPAFVDWDFIPYNDSAVVEWYSRFRLAEAFFKADGRARCRLAREISTAYRVTHVILGEGESISCPGWRVLFTDETYRVYAIAF